MSSPRPASAVLRRISPLLARLRPRVSSASVRELGRRVLYFWLVWSALLLVHEAGHAVAAARQGLVASRVTVGVGPVLWRGDRGDTEIVLRLVPVAGMTTIHTPRSASVGAQAAHSSEWNRQLTTLGGGTLATLALGVLIAAAIAARERITHARWVLGRMLVADAVVLTVFNFLPVPPLDGGRAALGAVDAWRDAPLAGDTLFWLQAGGLALAVVPMLLWTRWTTRIDRASMTWWVPRPRDDRRD